MRRRIVIALGMATIVAAGCESVTGSTATTVTSEDRAPRASARVSVVRGANVAVYLPSTIYANPETNTCDLPLTYEAAPGLSTPAYFDAGSVQAAGVSYSLSRTTFASIMGTTIVPGFAYTGIIYDWTLNPPHAAAPYTGNVTVQVVEGGSRWFGILNYECLAGSQGTGGGSGIIDPP